MRIASNRNRRRGTAAVEGAFLVLPLFITVVGIWEVTRLLECQQILANAAREGVRLAVSGRSKDADGNTLQEYSFGQLYQTSPNLTATDGSAVQKAVKNHITRSGLDTSTMAWGDITLQNLDQTSLGLGNVGNKDYYWQNASQNNRIKVTVSYPASKVRWFLMSSIIDLRSTLTASAQGISVRDVPLTVSSDTMKN